MWRELVFLLHALCSAYVFPLNYVIFSFESKIKVLDYCYKFGSVNIGWKCLLWFSLWWWNIVQIAILGKISHCDEWVVIVHGISKGISEQDLYSSKEQYNITVSSNLISISKVNLMWQHEDVTEDTKLH